MAKMNEIPTQQQLMWPVLQAMRNLGGSARNPKISERVADLEGFSKELLAMKHKPGSSQSAIDYRLAWARTRLRHISALENPARSIWTLTKLGHTVTEAEMERLDKAHWLPHTNCAQRSNTRRGTAP